jgi:glutaredoxin 3
LDEVQFVTALRCVMSNATQRIEQTVSDHVVVIFSKTYCSYCDRVKYLLLSLGVKDAHVVELDRDPQGSALQQQLFKMTKSFTVPSVWIGAEYIGGCDTTTELHGRGGLLPKIAAAHAAAASAAVAEADETRESPESRIAEFVKTNPVAVFADDKSESKTTMELFSAVDVAPAVLELDADPHGADMRAALGKQTGSYSLPCIWIGGKLVGGHHDIEKLNRFGNLAPKIAAAVVAHEEAIEEADRKLADTLISSHAASQQVALFSKSFCRFSSAVKEALAGCGITPAVFELDKHPKGHAVMEELVRQTGRLTVPSVWINAKYIGGNGEVQALINNGELAKLVQDPTAAS